jgi:hypothetical protein
MTKKPTALGSRLRAEITPAPRSIASSKSEIMPMKRYGADIDDLNRRRLFVATHATDTP